MTTALAVVTAIRDGAEITPRVPDSDPDDLMVNNERTVVVIDNSTGLNTVTVKMITQQQVDGEAIDDKTFTVATLKTFVCGPWPDVTYNEQTGVDEGKVTLQFTGQDANTKIFAIDIPLV